mmetsp:Transcript_47763/g.139297  ORF Transcript_47763/g.139297 Transcript_47763/m.139297 type:complete len:206 (-) Transcript_47763:502-1119(-)
MSKETRRTRRMCSSSTSASRSPSGRVSTTSTGTAPAALAQWHRRSFIEAPSRPPRTCSAWAASCFRCVRWMTCSCASRTTPSAGIGTTGRRPTCPGCGITTSRTLPAPSAYSWCGKPGLSGSLPRAVCSLASSPRTWRTPRPLGSSTAPCGRRTLGGASNNFCDCQIRICFTAASRCWSPDPAWRASSTAPIGCSPPWTIRAPVC